MCENKVSAPCTMVSKFGMYWEKERFKPLHYIVIIFLVDLTLSSSVKRTSKKPLVSKMTNVYEASRCSLK